MQPAAIDHELEALILSYHPIVTIETAEEERLGALLRNIATQLRMILFDWSATQGLVRVPGTAAFFGTVEPLGALQHVDGLSVESIVHLKDFAPFLETPSVRRSLRETAQRFAGTRSTLILSGTSLDLPEEIRSMAVNLAWQLPTPAELRRVLDGVVRTLRSRARIRVELTGEDVEQLTRALAGLTLAQARQTLAYAAIEDGCLDSRDIDGVLRRKAEIISEGGVLEFRPADHDAFEIGGFARLKEWLDRARVGFSPRARELNLPPPRGILLVGVQGCGKSLAAKFVASQWKMPLLKLDAGGLYDKYIGETEKNLRRAITVAESMSPAILWIDEIEKAFAMGGSAEADGGLSRRVLGTFLSWLQERRSGVFVVGAANDLSIVPPELLRKGRFDEIFFVDLPEPAEREEILRIHLRLRRQTPSQFDLGRLSAATAGFSGAEIEQVVISSLYRSIQQSQNLSTDLMLAEIAATVPLSKSRREDIEALRTEARGRFVPVS
ncbi:MAG: AAA family ATPase [Thermoanaerobaculia bacterium]